MVVYTIFEFFKKNIAVMKYRVISHNIQLNV